MDAKTKFKFQALDSAGQTIRGQVEAKDEAEAFRLISERGTQPVVITREDAASTLFRRRTLSRRDQAVMIRQLATLISAGVPLLDAVGSLARSKAMPVVAERAGRMRTALRGGAKFSASLEAEFPGLPGYVPRMAELGEKTGRLGPALLQAADQFDQDQKLASDVRAALAYPIFLICAGFVIVLMMFLFVVPRFAELIARSSADIPEISRIVISSGTWLSQNIVLFGILASGSAAIVIAVFRSQQGLLTAMGALLPGFGRYLETRDLAQWCATMGGALKYGSGLLPALQLARRGLTIPRLSRSIRLVEASVRSGEPIDEAIEKSVSTFDQITLDLIRTGRTSGKLDQMLEFAAARFRQELDERTKQLTSIIEPLAIVIISGIVGTIVVSIVLAMTSLYEISG
jgi:type II secretory pathway component PulF